MGLNNPQTHRASALKQQNKKHGKLGHRSKGQIASQCKGRMNIEGGPKKKTQNNSKEERKNINKQLQIIKKLETLNKKRFLGTSTKPPFLICVIPLFADIDTNIILKTFNDNEEVCATHSTENVLHISYPRLKQRFSFVSPPTDDLFSIYDTLKVCDTVMFLWKFDEPLSEKSKDLVNSLKHHALPSPVHVVVADEDLALKKRHRVEKELRITISGVFPENKFFSLEKTNDILLLFRQIGLQKRKNIIFRDKRTHLIAEKVTFIEKDSLGTMQVEGYVRGTNLSANDLIHIPGWDSFQILSIYANKDPFPLKGKHNSMETEEGQLIEMPDPVLQELLVSSFEEENVEKMPEEIDENGNEADEALEDKVNKIVKLVPTGTSVYQAAWLVSDDEGEDDDDDDNMSVTTNYIAPGEDDNSDEESDFSNEEDDEDLESIAMNDAVDDYDKGFDLEEEMEAMRRIKASDDMNFPDEVDTPRDVAAKKRFAQYRGLESFRTSKWDFRANLPDDYKKIYNFPKFRHMKRKILNLEKEGGAEAGTYVTINVKNVPQFMYEEHKKRNCPLVLFSNLKYERKMTVLNVVLKSFAANHHHAIKSKEKLIFHVGIARYANNPIFSEHTNGNKHKFLRFFHPGDTVVATMYAPVAYPPCPVSVYQQRLDGTQVMVATGFVYTVDANRLIIKRAVLAGHPFKVNKKSAVIRYMFFNPADINWFKPIELHTKMGKKGHIVEPIGSHGHMKCKFSSLLRSQDTVLLKLYKRVYPKWCFDPYVERPLQSARIVEMPTKSSLFDSDALEYFNAKKKVRFDN